MGKVDPRITFWLGVATAIAQGVGGGTVHLTNLVPMDWIPFVTAWMQFIAFVNVAVMTALAGMSGPGIGPLAAKPTIAEAQQVMKQAQETGK